MNDHQPQIPLLPALPVGHVPATSSNYVVALQNRKGERDALKQADASTWEHLTPIVHLATRESRKPVSGSSIRDQVRRIAEAVGDNTIYLDTLRLGGTFPVRRGKTIVPLLEHIFAQARKRDMRFVPVARAGEEASSEHRRLISNAALEDGRGVAVRYQLRTFVPPSGQAAPDYLQQLLTDLEISVDMADLIVDLGYIDEDVELDSSDLAQAIHPMIALGDWRSLVLMGTSMPTAMSVIKEGTMDHLPRREWDIWTALRQDKLPRPVAFGDYAIQNPRPPASSGPGMRANIRYTVKDGTLVARGKGAVIQEGLEQYRDLCQQLVRSDRFSGADYTWGDSVIDGCARGVIAPGAQEMWRGAGTSHHLRFVIDQLQQLQGAP